MSAGIATGVFGDIRDASSLAEFVRTAQPQIVFHLAAQPLVRASYRDPLATLETNIMGTAYMLEALRGVDGLRVAVMVTSDKVYHVGASSRPLPKAMRSAASTLTAPAKPPAKSSSPAIGMRSCRARA